MWRRKSVSGLRNLEKTEFFQACTYVGLGPQMLFRHKWRKSDAVSLCLLFSMNIVASFVGLGFLYRCIMFWADFLCIAMLQKCLHLDRRTYLATKGLILEFVVGLSFFVLFSWLWTEFSKQRLKDILLLIRESFFLMFCSRGSMVCCLTGLFNLATRFCNIDWCAPSIRCTCTPYMWSSSSLVFPLVMMKYLYEYFWNTVSPFSIFSCLPFFVVFLRLP